MRSSASTGATSNVNPALRRSSARRGDDEASSRRTRRCYIRRVDALQSIVPRALAELLRHGPMSQGKVEVAWRAAVGDALSRVSAVKWQPNGVVEVRAADARWNRELK